MLLCTCTCHDHLPANKQKFEKSQQEVQELRNLLEVSLCVMARLIPAIVHKDKNLLFAVICADDIRPLAALRSAGSYGIIPLCANAVFPIVQKVRAQTSPFLPLRTHNIPGFASIKAIWCEMYAICHRNRKPERRLRLYLQHLLNTCTSSMHS